MPTVAEDRFADIKQWYQSLFQLQEETLNGEKRRALFQVRKAAIQRLPEMDFPTRRDEDWKYTTVTKVLQPKYQDAAPAEVTPADIKPFLFEGLDVNLLVFVNGVYNEALSDFKELPGAAELITLEAAMEDERYREQVDKHFVSWNAQDKNPFVALNTAFARHGVFIHVPKNVVVERPVHCLHIVVPGEQPVLISPQSLVVAEQSSQVTVLESYHVLPGREGAPFFINLVNRMTADPNATIRHFKVQQVGEQGFVMNTTTVDQERDSTYSNFSADLGGELVRNNLSAYMFDQHTMTNMYGIFLGTKGQHVDNQTLIDHAFAHGQSNELYKGILTDRSRGVFNGKVMVHQDAQKINAFQQNSTLVLSDKAQMDSKPQLEIFADDVRCSHGATIGQLEEEAVFYLRSRGLTDAQARSLLQHAFIREVIDFIEIDAVREKVDELVTRKFEDQWAM